MIAFDSKRKHLTPWRERPCMDGVHVSRWTPRPKGVRYIADAGGKLRRTVVDVVDLTPKGPNITRYVQSQNISAMMRRSGRGTAVRLPGARER